MSYLLFINIISIVVISSSWCQRTEQITAEIGRPFSFDCKQGESVYFGRRKNEWTNIQENNNNEPSLQFEFDSLSKEKILRVSSKSAQLHQTGYYGCGRTDSINRIYQLVLADVQSFYWTYTCHGRAGACIRSDDQTDETLSTFEVADRTNVDLFCCASVTGYNDLNIKMNQIGEIRGQIDVKRKNDLDGSTVICANQHTLLTRTSSQNQQTLTCELITDGRSHSSLSSVIVMKDGMVPDPDLDPIDDEFFNPQKPSSAGKFMTGKKIAIIIGPIIAGLLLLGLVFGLIFFLCLKKKTSPTQKSNNSKTDHEYAEINQSDKPGKQNPREDEHLYLEPTPHYQNTPVNLRL